MGRAGARKRAGARQSWLTSYQEDDEMRHHGIYEKALLIDKFVEFYLKARKRKTFPHKEVGQLIGLLFPGSRKLGRGAFKTVYRVSSTARDLALKISREDSVTKDIEVYNRLPSNIRNRCFAKIYWHTRFCLLQKYGKAVTIPPQELEILKEKGTRYGLTDVRVANVRKVEGRFKIVDAIVK